MGKTKYILRFDDICPTMKWSIWNQIVELLDRHEIKPIIGVIPNNHDPELMCEPENPRYWEWIRECQSKGWTIALHGFTHVYENQECGIIGVNDYSEFVGVEANEQLTRIEAGLELFRQHGIYCKTWIAPAHSFDRITLKCLKKAGISVVSDGYSHSWFRRAGLLWVPCQLYKFSDKKNGIWTVCKHPSMWNLDDLNDFIQEIEKWKDEIVSFDSVVENAQKPNKKRIDCLIESSVICLKNKTKRKLKKVIMKSKNNTLKSFLVKLHQKLKGDPIEKSRREGG